MSHSARQCAPRSCSKLRGAMLSAVQLLLALAYCGCGETELDTHYGRRSGYPGGESVNGTSALAEMFEQAGHNVRSWRRLSPTLEYSDTIVWFPDSFEPPDQQTRTWLEEWLHREPGRTLIYVGRDYDAAPEYWEKMAALVPASQQAEFERRKRLAAQRFSSARSAIPDDEDCVWFTTDTDSPRRQVTTLSGPWAEGIDASQADIHHNSALIPLEWDEVLLESQGDALVTELTYENLYDRRFIVVTNGSFLLNMPLVNKENRKLAGRLVDAVGEPGEVTFLESGPGGPPILDEEPAAETPTGLEAFKVWPLKYVLLHLALVGLFFLFACWPIFGLPRGLPSPPLADFAQHVRALGKLLARSRDRAYAIGRVHYYYQVIGDERAGRGGSEPAAGIALDPQSEPAAASQAQAAEANHRATN